MEFFVVLMVLIIFGWCVGGRERPSTAQGGIDVTKIPVFNCPRGVGVFMLAPAAGPWRRCSCEACSWYVTSTPELVEACEAKRALRRVVEHHRRSWRVVSRDVSALVSLLPAGDPRRMISPAAERAMSAASNWINVGL